MNINVLAVGPIGDTESEHTKDDHVDKVLEDSQLPIMGSQSDDEGARGPTGPSKRQREEKSPSRRVKVRLTVGC